MYPALFKNFLRASINCHPFSQRLIVEYATQEQWQQIVLALALKQVANYESSPRTLAV
ncbi:hypothetical protein [Nostoc sp.]|uniref:hypothetical protein n=1 Tax=Nostoc sp. TaxID=1180 RepID=UPI002FFB503E